MHRNSAYPTKAAALSASLIALTAIAGAAHGQSLGKPAGDDRMNRLEQEVRILRNRVKMLEQNKAGQATKRVVTSDNDRIKVKIYGQVNRAVLVSVAKRDTQVHNVDNNNSVSRIGVIGTGRLGGGWGVGARIEVGLLENNSTTISDRAPSVSDIDLRRVELWIGHKAYGRLWLGKGPTATDDISNSDLSGTSVVTSNAIMDMAGGINFHKDGDSTPITINNMFNNLDGNSRRNRVRYDTPIFFGFQLRASYDEADVFGVALFYEGNPFGAKTIKVAASFGYVYAGGRGATDPSSGSPGDRNLLSGSISALHVPSGLSVTFQMASRTSHAPSDDQWDWYIKAGWQGRPFAFGLTALSIDYGRGDNFQSAGSRLWTIGFGLVQKIDRAAMEIYLAYRYHHAITRAYGTLDAIHAIMSGARVKF